MTLKLLLPPKSPSYVGDTVKFRKYSALPSSSQDHSKRSPEFKVNFGDEKELESLPSVLSLREFPKQQLAAKVVMVRFDSTVSLKKNWTRSVHQFPMQFSLSSICMKMGQK